MTKFILAFTLLLFPLFAYSQNDLPSIKPMQQGLKAGWFSRMDGEFIVELPQGASKGTFVRGEANTTSQDFGYGETHIWNNNDIQMMIEVLPIKKPGATEEDFTRYIDGKKQSLFKENKDAAESFEEGYDPGQKCLWYGARVVRGDVVLLTREFIFRKRLYRVSAEFKTVPSEDVSVKFMNSFRLVDREKIAEMRIEAAMPEPLPQTPAIKYPKSDAEDLGLKGKVKVFYETLKPADRSPDALLAGRQDEVRFNSDGYLLCWIQYESGEPFLVTVFGYIDGKRVTKNVNITRDAADAAVTAAAVKPPSTGPEAPRDMRYSESFVYKYDKMGLPSEVLNYSNNGTLQLRSVITRNGSTVKQINFDGVGKPTSHSIDTLGKRGELIESTLKWLNMEHEGYTIVYKYAGFDAQGNWIERTQSTKKIVAGKVTLSPVQTEYRRIEYYP